MIFDISCGFFHDPINIKRSRRDQIDDVDRSFEKNFFTRTKCESDQKFKSEPNIANKLDVKKSLMWSGFSFVNRPNDHVGVDIRLYGKNAGRQRGRIRRRSKLVFVRKRIISYVFKIRQTEIRMRFQTERQNGNANEEDGCR